MESEIKKISFCTFNIKGYDSVAAETIDAIMPKCTFLLLQETWQYEQDFINNFKRDFKNKPYECIAANKNDLKEIKVGKANGGTSICYHSNSNCTVETIPTKSKCFCAQKIKIGLVSLLLINVYMPCSNEKESLEEYSKILLEVSSICLLNMVDFIIIGGDWNADPGRKDGKTTLFNEFLKNENLYNALDAENADIPYTFMSNDKIGNRVGSKSKIDHFIISPSLKNAISEYTILDEHENGSDHRPILLTLDIDINMHKMQERNFKPSVAWEKCDNTSIGHYQNVLDQKLLQINPKEEGWSCRNSKCTKHSEFIQSKYNTLVNLWLEASNASLPHTSNNGNHMNKTVPGWNEHVRDRKLESKRCHDAWVRAGKPRSTQKNDIADQKRISRLRYHYALRYVTKENIRIRNIKMGEAVANNDDRCLWDEARKKSKSYNYNARR